MPCPMLQVRLLEDTRHGARGESVYLPLEYAEALTADAKAVVLNNKSMTYGKAVRKNGIPTKPLHGGVDPKRSE